MPDHDRMLNALRAYRDQLKQAIADRNEAWLVLARIATVEQLKAPDLRRLAKNACPCDPWDVRIILEPVLRCSLDEPAQREPIRDDLQPNS